MTPGRGSGGEPESRRREPRHIPVLVSEVLSALAPKSGETYIDATFGAGGYARAILDTAPCRLVALDRDPEAVKAGFRLVEAYAPRLTLIQEKFSNLADLAKGLGLEAVHGVVFDFGVSSMQLDEAERGFSFQSDGPLDMRMSRAGPTAADVVNTYEEEALADLIYELGEEQRSRAIARAIVKRRAERVFARTRELADLVSAVYRGRKGDPRHPATRTFQALRMHVNDELGEIERGLRAAERVLVCGGRLVAVTFHSLEDRAVKQFLQTRSGKEAHASRHMPERPAARFAPSFRFVNTRPLTPLKGEVDVNPRARSARLRWGVRTDAPAWLDSE